MRSQSESASEPSPIGAFLLALLPILFGILTLASRDTFASSPLLITAALVVAGIAWFVAVSIARRGGGDTRVVIAGAIALRLLALGSSPGLTSDPYRYLWDGELVQHGINPYGYAPGDVELAEVRAARPELAARVEHREVAAAYPPLMQVVGAAAARMGGGDAESSIGSGVFSLRVAFAIADLLVLWPLARMLGRAGLPVPLIVTWAWSPLVAVEFAGSAHFDSLGILFWLAALVLLRHPRAPNANALERGGSEPVGRVAFAAAVLVKLLPAVSLPWLAREAGLAREIAPRRAFGRILTIVGICALAYVPFTWMTGGERGVVGGLRDYGLRWESSSIVYRWIERGLSWTVPSPAIAPIVARAVAAAAWLACAVWIWRRVRDPWRASAALIASWLVLTPTLHPWYLAWLIPFLALYPSLAWTSLIAVIPILYWPLPEWQASGVWREPPWLWPAVFLPFLVALALEHVRRGRAAHEAR